METHFLNDIVRSEGPATFRAEPWYNAEGGGIVFQVADEAVVADRVDESLTIYNSALDARPIGFQIKGVRAIIRKFGLDGLVVTSTGDEEGVKNISIIALLLAVYEQGPHTLKRRKAYAQVMEWCSMGSGIPADQVLAG